MQRMRGIPVLAILILIMQVRIIPAQIIHLAVHQLVYQEMVVRQITVLVEAMIHRETAQAVTHRLIQHLKQMELIQVPLCVRLITTM